jgi:AraC family transcriptional regulator, regulatory protein of adaptative response / methylated-DNA-[protein]-cysteine methyltransferase
MEITYGIHKSPFGWCLIGSADNKVCQLSFIKKNSSREAERSLRETWPDAHPTRNDRAVKSYVQKAFGNKKPSKPVDMLVNGTPFQIKVWEALLSIPKGETASYAEVAQAIGSPKAVRAVGTACGKNSIAVLIPCHRVLTSSGGIGGYRSGIERKKAILAWESK